MNRMVPEANRLGVGEALVHRVCILVPGLAQVQAGFVPTRDSCTAAITGFNLCFPAPPFAGHILVLTETLHNATTKMRTPLS